MNYFSRHRSQWVIVLLVLLNIALLITLWYGSRQLPEGPPVMPFLEQELGLDAGQAEQFRELREQHFQRTRPLARQMQETRRAMLQTVASDSPRPAEAQALARQIGQQQAALEEALVDHFLALRAICTPEQQQKLDRLFLRAMERRRGPPEVPGSRRQQMDRRGRR